MAAAIKSANIYHFEPVPPTRQSIEIRKLIEYAKVNNFNRKEI